MSDQLHISPCSTRNITSHSLENLAFQSLLRWKMIVIPILSASCYDQGPEQIIYKCEMHNIV